MTKNINRPKPVVLIILDGWGVAPDSPGNAITHARTPNFDKLTSEYFTTTLHAAGEAVGLKWGEMGNSEVGHLNIGSGQIIFQPQQRIDKAIIDNSFFQNQVLLKAFKKTVSDKTNLHLIGLISEAGVHSTIEHLYALLELGLQQGLSRVFIHAILDGRDSSYNSGLKFINRLQAKIKEIGIGKIASITGRFYAMDRDNRWTRIKQAYQAIALGISKKKFTNTEEAIKESYENNIFDEEFEPVVIVDNNQAIGKMKNKDVVVFFNFRADRARQLSRALVSDDFGKFTREKIANLQLITFTEYDEKLDAQVAFPTPIVKNPLAGVVADLGLKQLHIAETEKYAHVTYFINGRREAPFAGEKRILIPSPPVTSYEEKPEMSALEIREKLVSEIERDFYDFYIVNFANADMVGHTGNHKAGIQAIEVLDLCLGNIVKAVLAKQGIICLTSDHGNAEGMIDITTGDINKEHSARPVPFIIIGEPFRNESALTEALDLSLITPAGILSDVAPTLLKIMNLKAPKEMTGRSLI